MSLWHPTRPKKVPFWSAIILQNQGTVSVAANSTGYVTIQPPPGETWWVEIALDNPCTSAGSWADYRDYDGSIDRGHVVCYTQGSYGWVRPFVIISRILTNSLYGYASFRNTCTNTMLMCYSYSGFKLSQPIWTPKRIGGSERMLPFKREATRPLPSALSGLEKYACEVRGLDPTKPDEYVLAIVLEEDTVLASDPATGFPIERFSAYVAAETLADLITKFKRREFDPIKAGFEKYLIKWRKEGLEV